MNKLIIFLVKGISGGTATLSYRIGCEYIRQGGEAFYVYDLCNDSKNENLLINAGFMLVQSCEKNWKKTVQDICKRYNHVIAFTYTLNNYYLLDSIKFNNESINKYLYIVSTASIVRGVSNEKIDSNKNYLCKISNRLNRKYIDFLYKNNHLLFMDELSLDIARKHLNLSFNGAEDNLFLLPYDVKKEPEFTFKSRNVIVTMARISFPFKGYILGLIDIFKRITVEYDCELWIIGDGESRTVLDNKIKELPDHIKDKIKLFNSVSYDKIGDILVGAKVFVGMGTGILDASAFGLPCIAVSEHTYDCLSKGRFDIFPRFVGFGQRDSNTHDIADEIVEIFEMDRDTYIDLCKKNYKALIDNYSMKEFYHRLEKYKNISEKKNRIDSIGPLINRGFTKIRDLIK